MRIIIFSIAFIFLAFSAQSQVLKSAGVWYFLDVDSMTARPAVLPNGTELAYVVGTKTVYYWNRNTNTWTAYGSTFNRDSIYFDSSIIGSGTLSDPWRVDSTLFATITAVGDSIAAALSYVSANYFPIQGGTLTGTGGNGFVGFPAQSSAPATPSTGVSIYASSGNQLSWMQPDGFFRRLYSPVTGTPRQYQFMARSYTLADSADLAIPSGQVAVGTGSGLTGYPNLTWDSSLGRLNTGQLGITGNSGSVRFTNYSSTELALTGPTNMVFTYNVNGGSFSPFYANQDMGSINKRWRTIYSIGFQGVNTSGTPSNPTYGFQATGAPIGSGMYFTGSAADQKIGLATNSIARMFINNFGFIGINNNTSPSYILDINSTDAIRIPRGTDAQEPTSAAGIFRYNTTGSGYTGNDGSGRYYFAKSDIVGGGGTNTYIPFFNSNGRLTQSSAIRTVSNSIYANNYFLNTIGTAGYYGTDVNQGLHMNSVETSLRIFGSGASYSQFLNINGNAVIYRAYTNTRRLNANIAATTISGLTGGDYSVTSQLAISGGSNGQSLTVHGGDADNASSGAISGNLILRGGRATTSSTAPTQGIIIFQTAPNTTSAASVQRGKITQDGLWQIGADATAARTLHVTGEVRITDLTTDTPTRIVGADADGDLGAITIGTGLSLTSGTLSATATADGNGIYSGSATLSNHTTRARVPDDGNLLFSQTYNSGADSTYWQVVNYGSGERALNFGITDTASTGYARGSFYSDGTGVMNWGFKTSDAVFGNTTVRAFEGDLDFSVNTGSISLTAPVDSEVRLTGMVRAKQEGYYEINSTSSPQNLSNTYSDNFINQGSTQATFTLVFPASPEDGQVLKITYNNNISALTLDGNGNTIVGTTVTTAVEGTQRVFKFYASEGVWIRQN